MVSLCPIVHCWILVLNIGIMSVSTRTNKKLNWETFSNVTCLNASWSYLWKRTLFFSPLLVQKVREVRFRSVSGTLSHTHTYHHSYWGCYFCSSRTTHILLKLLSGITKKRNIEHSFGWGEAESPATRESNYCYGRLSFGLDIEGSLLV